MMAGPYRMWRDKAPVMQGIQIFLLLVFLAPHSLALTEDLVAFSDEKLRPRYESLIQELRCPKCQNQNLADSNAPIASDLRREIRRLLEDGKSDEEIKSYLRDRYSDFVLYRPEVQSNTLFLWIAPVVVVIFGLVVVLLIVRRQRKGAEQPAADRSAQRERLAALFDDRSNRP